MTHTFARLEVSPELFDEVAEKLRAAGYHHAFVDEAIDMHGIGLVRGSGERSVSASMDIEFLTGFFDNMLGWRTVGVDRDGNEVAVPVCSEMRSFLCARLGCDLPINGYAAVRNNGGRTVMASFLREVASALEALSNG